VRVSPTALRRFRLATLVMFLSVLTLVFGFLWVNFGGSIPGITGGYRVTASLSDVQNLVFDSEVRIAGVQVGKIRGLERKDDRTDVVMEIRGDAQPLHEGATVRLRAKTLIEETYVEVTDGFGEAIPDGGRLPTSAEQPSVKFDDLLDTLTPPTRAALASAVRRLGAATEGEAAALSATLAALGHLGRDGHDAVDVIASQSQELAALVGETAKLLSVLDEGQGQIARLVTVAERFTRATADKSTRLEETILLLPGLLDRAKAASPPVRELAAALAPLAEPLRAAAPDLQAALEALPGVSADLRGLVPPLDQALDKMPATFDRTPAAAADISALVPTLRVALADVNPMLAYLAPYGRDLAGLVANAAQAANATDPEGKYLRILAIFDQGSFTGDVAGTKTKNPYPPAGTAENPQPFSGPVPRVPEEQN
jgi:phospholipid/cholesterol/gamma-HCH transport system substrate-binding protein